MTKIKVIVATIVAAAAGAVTVGVVFGNGSSSPPRASLSVFATPRRNVDKLPAAFAKSEIAHHFRSANSRLVATNQDARWWAVPGTHKMICLAGLRNDGTTFGPCAAFEDLATQPMVYGYATGKKMDGNNVRLVGIANDGITHITIGNRTVRVRRNAFHLTVARGHRYELRATGPNVKTQTNHLALRTPVTK